MYNQLGLLEKSVVLKKKKKIPVSGCVLAEQNG